jgi:hypothetical protein
MTRKTLLAKYILECYNGCSTKQKFIRDVKASSIFSNCEDDVIETFWEVIELIPTPTLIKMLVEIGE